MYIATQDFDIEGKNGLTFFLKGKEVNMDELESDVYPSLLNQGLIEDTDAPKKGKTEEEKEQPAGLSIGEIYELCEKAGVKPDELKLKGEGPFSTAEVKAAIKTAKEARKTAPPTPETPPTGDKNPDEESEE